MNSYPLLSTVTLKRNVYFGVFITRQNISAPPVRTHYGCALKLSGAHSYYVRCATRSPCKVPPKRQELSQGKAVCATGSVIGRPNERNCIRAVTEIERGVVPCWRRHVP